MRYVRDPRSECPGGSDLQPQTTPRRETLRFALAILGMPAAVTNMPRRF